MSFQITITEKRDVVKRVGKDWATIGEREVAREPRFIDEDGQKTRIEEVRGYTPEIEKTVAEEREVLKQTVDELDLAAVIRAINKL